MSLFAKRVCIFVKIEYFQESPGFYFSSFRSVKNRFNEYRVSHVTPRPDAGSSLYIDKRQ